MILLTGLFIGMVRGQEVRQRWMNRMKNRHEEKEMSKVAGKQSDDVLLDEFEMAAYHS